MCRTTNRRVRDGAILDLPEVVLPDIMMRLGREVLVLDGAMGTMLQRAGMLPGSCPELLNITAPEMVGQVLDFYRLAGSDCAITNTFGGSGPKLAEYGYADRVEEFNRAAVKIAKRYGAPHVLADMGPTGLVMEPLGTATFDEVFSAFAEQARALAADGPDALFIETMTDIAEARCAVLAAKSVTDLPVFVSCTFGMNGRMDLSGTDPATAAVILEAAGADAIGLNCGLGPDQMLPLVAQMVKATKLPIIAQPNAGMPTLDDSGATVFPGTPEDLGAFADAARALGVAAVGGCCGTSPAFIGAIVDAVADKDCVGVAGRGFAETVVAGPRGHVVLGGDQPLRVIGERINPTGKPTLKESLLAGSMSVVRAFAAEQQNAGADLLDVNVGAAGVDAAVVLPQAVLALVGATDLPLVIDTTDPVALEAALRLYPGKALVNSVNGDPSSLESVLPLVARYGAAVVVLALDDSGIPHDSDGRAAVVARVREQANRLGIADTNLVVDSLVMTAATDADAPAVTLAATAAATEAGLATVLGVSNVSHGLPDRPLLNAAFIEAAAAAGLSAAIANPNDAIAMEAVRLINQARSAGESASSAAHEDTWAAWQAAYELALQHAAAGIDAASAAEEPGAPRDAKSDLEGAVLRGDAEAAATLVDAVVADGVAPGEVIGSVLTPAIQRLGDAYGRGEVFLPQMMVAAEAMKSAVARVKELLPEGESASAGRVAFATVKGDIHSIGKDICVSLLESQGFDVDDLGVDVSVEAVLEAAQSAEAVCLSALMTTTLPAMRETVEKLRDAAPAVHVFVGGAVVTPEWAAQIGAGYSADAPGCVEVVSESLAGGRPAS